MSLCGPIKGLCFDPAVMPIHGISPLNDTNIVTRGGLFTYFLKNKKKPFFILFVQSGGNYSHVRGEVSRLCACATRRAWITAMAATTAATAAASVTAAATAATTAAGGQLVVLLMLSTKACPLLAHRDGCTGWV